MIRSFSDSGTEDLFYRRDTKAARKACPREAWSAAQRKLDYMHAAKDVRDLSQLPGARFEPKEGKMKGWYTIRINDRYRIMFRWSDNAAENVQIEDYH